MMIAKNSQIIVAALSLLFILLAGVSPALSSVQTCLVGGDSVASDSAPSTPGPILADYDSTVRSSDLKSALTAKPRIRLKRSVSPQPSQQQSALENHPLIIYSYSRDRWQRISWTHLASPTLKLLRTVILLN